MTARVYIHPRCCSGPAQGALIAALEARGFGEPYAIGPKYPSHAQELVKIISQDGIATSVLERMDGTRFAHRAGASAPSAAPEAA